MIRNISIYIYFYYLTTPIVKQHIISKSLEPIDNAGLYILRVRDQRYRTDPDAGMPMPDRVSWLPGKKPMPD
jgi:hypothetical protein